MIDIEELRRLLANALEENERLREALNDMVGSTLGAKTGAGDGDTYAVYPPSPQALASARRALENKP